MNPLEAPPLSEEGGKAAEEDKISSDIANSCSAMGEISDGGSMETLEESSNIETRVDSNEHDDFHDNPTTKTTDLKHDARKDNPREDDMKPEGDESAPVTIDREASSSAALPSVIIATPDFTPENEKEYVIVGKDTETAPDAAHDVEPTVDAATLVSSNSSEPVVAGPDDVPENIALSAQELSPKNPVAADDTDQTALVGGKGDPETPVIVAGGLADVGLENIVLSQLSSTTSPGAADDTDQMALVGGDSVSEWPETPVVAVEGDKSPVAAHHTNQTTADSPEQVSQEHLPSFGKNVEGINQSTEPLREWEVPAGQNVAAYDATSDQTPPPLPSKDETQTASNEAIPPSPALADVARSTNVHNETNVDEDRWTGPVPAKEKEDEDPWKDDDHWTDSDAEKKDGDPWTVADPVIKDDDHWTDPDPEKRKEDEDSWTDLKPEKEKEDEDPWTDPEPEKKEDDPWTDLDSDAGKALSAENPPPIPPKDANPSPMPGSQVAIGADPSAESTSVKDTTIAKGDDPSADIPKDLELSQPLTAESDGALTTPVLDTDPTGEPEVSPDSLDRLSPITWISSDEEEVGTGNSKDDGGAGGGLEGSATGTAPPAPSSPASNDEADQIQKLVVDSDALPHSPSAPVPGSTNTTDSHITSNPVPEGAALFEAFNPEEPFALNFSDLIVQLDSGDGLNIPASAGTPGWVPDSETTKTYSHLLPEDAGQSSGTARDAVNNLDLSGFSDEDDDDDFHSPESLHEGSFMGMAM